MKLTYDGHGLNNADDAYRTRVMTWQRHSPENGGGFTIADDAERDRLGRLLAAAPALRDALVEAYDFIEGNVAYGTPAKLARQIEAALDKSK